MIICNRIFTVQCDRCERFYMLPDTDNAEGFDAPESAKKQVESDGWAFENHDCYCPYCMRTIMEARKERKDA